MRVTNRGVYLPQPQYTSRGERTGRISRAAQLDEGENALESGGATSPEYGVLGWNRFLRFLRRGSRLTLRADPIAPPILVACLECGFDYSVRTIKIGGNERGSVWVCECGSRYIPPGGEMSHRVVRP